MSEARFKFISEATNGDGFVVVGFSASEGISRLYRYELELKVLRSTRIDADEVMDSPAKFIIDLNGDEFPVHGVLATLDEIKTVQGYVHYRAELVPRLWWLSQYKTNEIYTHELTIDRIIQVVLENAGLNAGSDFDLGNLTTGNLIKRDYRCQFGESDFDFLSRLMEHEGIFYYFEQSSGIDKIVFHNGSGFLKIPHPELIFDTSTQTRQLHDSINAWTCRRQRLPASVSVRDFNPDQPSLDISDTVSIDPRGRGTEYQYGENIRDENEATTLSEIRAEESLCHKTRYYGESSVPRLRPGFTFNLDMHPNEEYNGVEYLVVEVNHDGQHLDMALAADDNPKSRPHYNNSFVAIDAHVQFRPPRVTPRPRFYGTMTGFIYAEVGHNQAEIDEYGRYRVHLPFDRADGSKDSSDPNRKASAWIRRATDYVGENKGSYFPLTGGTEVLLSFINGDPDQPVIIGALPNASEPSLMNHENQFESRVQTGSGNKIRMGDVEGQDRIVMESPMANSWLRIGTPNDPITLQGESPQHVIIGSGTYNDPQAYSTDSSTTPATVSSPFSAAQIKDKSGSVVASIDTNNPGEYTLRYESANSCGVTDTAFRKVIVGESVSTMLGNASDGIRIRSAGNLWLEAKSRYGEYHTGKPNMPAPATTPSQTGDMLANFGNSYKPKNLRRHHDQASLCTTESNAGTTNDDSFANAFAQGHVRVSSFDTFNTQEGNIYDFGGYWNYNLGNSYAEEHINQQANLNQINAYGFPDFNTTSTYSKASGNSAGSGAITGAVAGGLLGAAPVGVFASYLTVQINSLLAPHLWSGAGGVAVGLGVGATTVFLSALATAVAGGIAGGVGAAVGAGLGAIAPTGETFSGNVGDVIGGPNSGSIKTWAYRVGSSFSGGTQRDKPEDDYEKGAPKSEMNTSTTWVTKQFGDSYSYARGNDIDIRVGNTESHHHGNTNEFLYGGFHEETKFNGSGKKLHWEKGGGGVKQEARWHSVSGLLTSFEYKDNDWFTYEGNFVTIPTLKISTSMSSVRGSLDLSLGALDIDVTGAVGIKMDINMAAGLWVNMHGKLGGEAEVNFATGEAGFKSLGLKAQKKAALDAKMNDLILKEVKLNLESGKLDLKSGGLELKDDKLQLKTGQQISV